jgi:hypothetical protein
VLRRWVHVRTFDYIGDQIAGAFYGRVEVLDLEPQDDAVADRCRGRIDDIGVIFFIPDVQLKKQGATARDPIIDVAMAMFWQ